MLTVHLPGGEGQRAGPASSSLHLLQAIAASEAYLPWNPLAILAGLLFAILSVVGLIALLCRNHDPGNEPPTAPASSNSLASITLFALLFFVLVAASGLGGKPRNGLLLIPALAPAAAWIVGTLRPRAQLVVLLFLALWSGVGVAHMLTRHGLAKATMNDHPEQVVAFVRQSADTVCSVVVTYDAPLAFSLAQSNLPRLLIVSPFRETTFGGSLSLPDNDCAHTTLYAVHSYIGGNIAWATVLHSQLDTATHFIQGQAHTRSFSFDPDAGRKRSLARIPRLGGDLASAAQLPDYRYIVISGPIDRANIAAMRTRMPDFTSGTTHGTDPFPTQSAPSH